MSDIEKVLRTIYYDPSNPASFSSPENLYYAAKSLLPKLSINDVRKWLSGEFTYTLHKPIRKNFLRNKIIVEHIDQQWEADLVDMQEFKSQNNDHNYILTVIDVMSKYAFAVPLKNKKMATIVEAFKEIFERGRKPKFLRTDQGKEFLNSVFKKFLRNQNVFHFTSKNQTIKCAIIERFNRTLKSRMFKYFTSQGTRKWIDVLENLILAYNSNKHRSIKMTPIEASSSKNSEIFRNLYGAENLLELLKNHYDNQNELESDDQLEEGDIVRKQYKIGPFDKSYYPNWTDREFKIISKSSDQDIPLYRIENEEQKQEKQRFYPEEVQKITPNLYRVEKNN